MKKTVLGMAMMAMALVGFNGMAQNTTQSQKAQVENKACCKQGEKKDGRKGMKKEKMNPYEGLNLTDAQKAKLAELDAKQQAKRQAKMDERKDGKKADRQNMTEAEIQAAVQARNDARKAEKIEYLQAVKEIVGPEQYVVFLENIYVNGGAQKGGKAFMQGKDGRKGMAQGQKGGKSSKKGDKGNRKGGQRGQKSATAAQS